MLTKFSRLIDVKNLQKIAMGGGCHWCTEAVFLSLKGVQKVEQGFVGSEGENSSFSEAVIVYYDREIITLQDLISIHLHTHESTADHSMRDKYRSAIYTFNNEESILAEIALKELQLEFEKQLVTQVLPFKSFKLSDERFHNYYYSDKEKPFCKTYIEPKLKLLLERFSEFKK